jgi:hypothetical protein
MFITFIIVCIFIGLFLSFILAPIIVVQGAKKIKEMRRLIEEFEALPVEEKESRRMEYKHKLVDLKGKINPSDKQSTEKARDILSLI